MKFKQYNVRGWTIRLHYDKEGWWLTCNKGYRNKMILDYSLVTNDEGQLARRIVLWGFMMEWAYPKSTTS